MTPRIRFIIRPEKDIDTFFSFVGETYDREQLLTWAIWNPYPKLKSWFNQNIIIVDRLTVETFIKKEYADRRKTIEENMRQYEMEWRAREQRFNKLIEEIFPGAEWPPGKYECLPTIWGMYPRFLEDKTFQVPWRHDKPVMAIIAHEMLHFIWYEQFYKTHSSYRPNTNDDYFVWNVSELFNSIVQGTPKWVKIFGQEPMSYPQHDAILAKLRPKYAYKTGWSASELTEELIMRVKEAKLAEE